MSHYIAMAGLKGCLPNVCEALPNVGEAADYICQAYDLDDCYIQALVDCGYIDLGYGYIEVVRCDCDEPESHCDSGEYN